VLQLSVLLVRSQQEVHVYITAILVPYKMAVNMQKSYFFQYIIQSYTHRGKRSYTGGAG